MAAEPGHMPRTITLTCGAEMQAELESKVYFVGKRSVSSLVTEQRMFRNRAQNVLQTTFKAVFCSTREFPRCKCVVTAKEKQKEEKDKGLEWDGGVGDPIYMYS
jgi:hypothetical protein